MQTFYQVLNNFVELLLSLYGKYELGGTKGKTALQVRTRRYLQIAVK